MESTQVLSVGDVVSWSHAWGTAPFRPARVKRIEILLFNDGSDSGVPVDSVPWTKASDIIVDLDNGHWAYGTQLQPATAEDIAELQLEEAIA